MGQAQAATYLCDIGGAQSIGELGNSANQIFTQFAGANLQITGISYNLTYTAFNPSWLSEGAFAVGSSDSSSRIEFTFANTDPNPGTGSYSCTLDIADFGMFTGSDGILRLEVYDDFDDFDGADGAYGEGSTLTVTTAGGVGAAPEPAAWAMMILGFGLAGYGLRRRSGRVAFA